MPPDAPPPPRDGLKRVAAHLLSAVIYVGAIVGLVYATRQYYFYPRTDDAYVRANTIGVAPHVSGPIVDLPIVDNQPVRAGQLMFVIDPRPYQAAYDNAVARLDLTRLQVRALQNSIGSARSQEQQHRANAAYARQYLERVEPLLPKHFVTADDVYNARTRYQAEQANVDSAHSDVDRAQNDLGQLGNVNTRIKAAEAEVYNAKLNLDYCRVVAPFDGYITNLNIAVGQYANEGREVLSLVDNRTWYVIANFRENFLAHIRTGMSAEVFLLAYPGHLFRGHVQGVGWALYQENGATVDGLPAIAPTLNWVRLSQRFPVRIILEHPDPEFPYRMGATAVVTIQGFH
jgi:membrane fusion protein, multidrug efflux system